MKFSLDAPAGVNLIRAYAAGEVRVGERTVNTNCIVAADALITDWSAQSVESLGSDDIDAVLALKPEVVLMGTGAVQKFPSAEVRRTFASRGVALEPMDLGAACRTFNILVQEERRVVAALFLD